MSFRFSITQKVFVLVAIPLICELIFLGLLGFALKTAEEESQTAEHARKVSDVTNNLVRDLYLIVNEMSLGAIEDRGELKGEFEETPTMVHAHQLISRLIVLTKDDPKTRRVVEDVQTSYKEAIAKFKEGWQACLSGDRKKFSYIKKKGLKQYIPRLISEELINVPKDEMEQYKHARENELRSRRAMETYIFGLFVASVSLTVLVAAALRLQITRRLSQLAAKTIAIARDEPLPEPLSGDDEIKDVDRALHSMAIALSEASHKEKAILVNARDLICSIDGAGKFSAVNAASQSILGYQSADLLGRYYIDVVARDDVNDVLKEIESVITKEESHEFEARLQRADGTLIDLLWSVHWSADERALFCVLHDVSARKEAERLRQEVISMVTHDLRTPLTAVRQIVEMFKDGAVGEFTPEADKMLTRIDTASTRMMLLINDLLDIEKIKSGLMELSYSKVLVTELFSQASETVAALVSEKEIALVDCASIEVESGGEDIELSVDPDRIIQVLVNLISNAIKFSPRKATIKLSALSKDGCVEFQVEDSGRGIPKEMLQQIFERFQQVEQSDAKVKGGSGLGLAICKSLVELHGGRIWAESEEGVGSILKFVVPKNPQATQL